MSSNTFLGKVFKSLSQLKKHIGVHKRKGSHLCQICGKQFTFPENLARHSRIHSGDKKYICKICSKYVACLNFTIAKCYLYLEHLYNLVN